MFDLGNAKISKLGLKEASNKYQIEDVIVDINAINDSHSIIAREILKDKRSLKILDIGCGSGLMADFLSNDSIIIDGIEIDDDAKNAALRKNIYRNIELVSIEEIDKSELESKFDKYDYIILADLLEHLISPYDVIEKLQCILKEDGQLLISIPNISHIDIIENLLNNKFNYNDVGLLDTTHLRFYTLSSFAQMIDNINQHRNKKIDLELIDSTKVLPDNIKSDSEMFKIINKNQNSIVLQYILKAKFLPNNIEPKNLNKILSNVDVNVFKILDEKISLQSSITKELKSKNQENEELLKNLEQKKCDIELLLSDNQELYIENNIIYEQMIDLKNEINLLHDVTNSMLNSRSWKLTNPLRKINGKVHSLKNKYSIKKIKNKISCISNISDVHFINRDIVDTVVDKTDIRLTAEELAEKLSNNYDIISFDMFDTLVFRPFVNPTDLFELIGIENCIDAFQKNRVKAESIARQKLEKKNFEANIFEIYDEFEKICNINKEEYIEKEIEMEKKLCYANPYMKEVFNLLLEKGKKIIVTSDMYWPSKYLKQILLNCGFDNIDEVFVSCEYRYGKASGEIQKIISKKYSNKKIIHVGDNYDSDINGSKKAGWGTFYYKNCKSLSIVNNESIYDESPISSMITAIKYNHLYCGNNNFSKYYKYGFNYGGVLTCGFLENINKIVEEEKIDKILFLARDSKIFYDIYNKFYKKVPNEYVIVSRCAMYEIMFEEKIDDYFDFYFTSRSYMEKYTIKQSLVETDLEILVPYLKKYHLDHNEILNTQNVEKLRKLVLDNKAVVTKYFASSKQAAIEYFNSVTSGSNRILAVDLGWSGTIVTLMRQFFKNNLDHPVELFGTFIGNVDSSKVNALVDMGVYKPYAFGYNTNGHMKLELNTLIGSTQAMMMECMFTSNDKTLLKYNTDNFEFGDSTSNESILNELHNGITEFAELYNSKLNNDLNNVFKLSSSVSFRPLRDKLNDFRYNYNIFKEFKEYQDSLPRFGTERKKTTIGAIMKNRNLI